MQKVSVIVPVYNVEQYLKECIDSIISQSYKNIEIILVDDGSTDNSGIICDQYAEKDDRIIVIHQDNQGLSGARNSGVKASSGEWITLVDGDDIVHPQMVEVFYELIKNTDAKIAFCKYAKSEVISKSFYKSVQAAGKNITISEEQMIHYYKTSNTFWNVTTRLVHRDIYLKHPMEIGRIYEDNGVACKWLYEAKKVIEIDLELYFYRQRKASIMNSNFCLKNLDYLWALEEQIKFFKNVGYYKMLSLALENYIMTAIYMRKRVMEELGDKKASAIVKKDIVRIKRKYRKYVDLNKNQTNTLMREIYPLRHKVRKRILSLVG